MKSLINSARLETENVLAFTMPFTLLPVEGSEISFKDGKWKITGNSFTDLQSLA